MISVWRAYAVATAGMAMSGGSMPAMPWMRMPGQTWLGAAASFLATWIVMMTAMMLPSLSPALRRYRRALAATGHARLAGPTAVMAAGYLSVWSLLGMAIFPSGAALTAVERQWPALARVAPGAIGAVVLVAGALQLTAWKRHHLACCREAPEHGRASRGDAGSAWRQGVRLGVHCICCTAGATAVLLAVGMMDARAMVVVTAAVTLERLAPAGERIARILGGVGVAAGVLLVARAAGL